MGRYYFIKEGAPVWIHVPGTPFTLPGERPRYTRLPGMSEWAPNEVVERVGKGLKQNVPIEELAESESGRGLLSSAGKGGIGGGIAGSMAARIVGGDAAVAPIKDIYRKGLSRKSLQGLRNLPRAAKILPLLGLGLGVTGGVGGWAMGQDKRRREAHEVAKGLLSEQVLQQHSIGKARSSLDTPLIRRQAPESASDPSPRAAVMSTTGV